MVSSDYSSSYQGYVYVDSYYDGDSGYGKAYYSYGYGYSGLGSESGYAYNSNYTGSDSYFSKYYEADLKSSLEKFEFTYYFGNGDYYTGYGYAAADKYHSGDKVAAASANETGGVGYYVVSTVKAASDSYGYDGYIYVDGYFDGDTSLYLYSNITLLLSLLTAS